MSTAPTPEALVAALSLEEKCKMVVGEGPWLVPGCERLGIPTWKTSDGPVGVRGETIGEALLLPSASSIAASWDVSLAVELGGALAAEAIDRHVDLVLGPTVNLHRSPRAGRHFEMMSEDPELTSRIAVAIIQGVQGRGVAACIKHYVGNEQEHERTTIDTLIDERTLREVYLRPFEAAVREAGVRAVMAAYNYVNGSHATANAHTNVTILKEEWGFEGILVSDWGATKETVGPAQHGLDLEMPGPGAHWGRGQLADAVRRGDVDEALLDDKVRRILGLLEWRGRLGSSTETAESPRSTEEHERLVRVAAAAGTVLIKNDGLLPLRRGATVALIGPGAADTALLGGGSAAVIPYRYTTVLDALRSRWEGTVVYDQALDIRRAAPAIAQEWVPGGCHVEVFRGRGFDTASVASDHYEQVSNFWSAGQFDVEGPISIRASFEIVAPTDASVRLMVAGFSHSRLLIDGVVVADNDIDAFRAGLGRSASVAEVTLTKGERRPAVLEVVPRAGSSIEFVLAEVGLAVLDGVAIDARLDHAAQIAAGADVAVVVVGSNDELESEGEDRPDLHLPFGQDELVRRVAAANPRTVVVLNCGAPMVLPWFDEVPAVVLPWYPGQEGGEAIVDVLVGDAEPGGRMPTTWARDERDTPSFAHYPGEGGTVRYGEGLLVGHRWYDAHGIEPLIPFGHGLSYTRFEWGPVEVDGDSAEVRLIVPVTNVGARPGAEVVQVYVAAVNPTPGRPPRELAGFAKLHLAPGETDQAVVRLTSRSFARWDITTGSWVVDPGEYELIVARSAAAEHERVRHKVDA